MSGLRPPEEVPMILAPLAAAAEPRRTQVAVGEAVHETPASYLQQCLRSGWNWQQWHRGLRPQTSGYRCTRESAPIPSSPTAVSPNNPRWSRGTQDRSVLFLVQLLSPIWLGDLITHTMGSSLYLSNLVPQLPKLPSIHQKSQGQRLTGGESCLFFCGFL